MIEQGNLLDVVAHHNHHKYPNQWLMIVKVLNTVVVMPFVKEADNTIFLKALYYSRAAKKKYLKG